MKKNLLDFIIAMSIGSIIGMTFTTIVSLRAMENMETSIREDGYSLGLKQACFNQKKMRNKKRLIITNVVP